MVFVDDAAVAYKGKARYHLGADSLQELHEFCAAQGIARCWFHRGARHPHYDVTAEQREGALQAGALAVSSRDFVRRALLAR